MSVHTDRILDHLTRIKRCALELTQQGNNSEQVQSIGFAVTEALREHEIDVMRLEEQLAARNAKIATMQLEADANKAVAKISEADKEKMSCALELLRGLADTILNGGEGVADMAARRMIETVNETLRDTCVVEGVQQEDGFFPEMRVHVVRPY